MRTLWLWPRWVLEAGGVCLLVGFFCLWPRRLSHFLGRRLGFYAYLFSKRSRQVAHENLELILGVTGAEARVVARGCMKQAGAALSDLLRAPRMKRLVARRDVEIPEPTWRAINAIRDGGRGAVFATSHLGNWEFANLAGPFSALPPQTVIVRPLPNPLLNRLMFRLRGRTGQKLLHRQGAAMECMQRVREGEVVVITFDLAVPPDGGAEPVEFLGLPTYTTVSVGYVAAMTRAPVYLAHFEPLGGCRYRFVLNGPHDAPAGETLRGTAVETTQRVSKALDDAIRAYPSGWAWWMKRWRIRPDDTTHDFPSYAHAATHAWAWGKKPRRDAFR